MERGFISWVENTWLSDLASHTSWLFVSAETAHFMGLSILIGSLAVLDLRILRIVRRFPIARLLDLIPLAIIGFSINLVSGVIMFSAEPLTYWSNPAFKLKLVLIAIGGVNALWFWFAEHQNLQALSPGGEARTSARIVAALSLGLWLLVLVLGRLLPYVEGMDLLAAA